MSEKSQSQCYFFWYVLAVATFLFFPIGLIPLAAGAYIAIRQSKYHGVWIVIVTLASFMAGLVVVQSLRY